MLLRPKKPRTWPPAAAAQTGKSNNRLSSNWMNSFQGYKLCLNTISLAWITFYSAQNEFQDKHRLNSVQSNIVETEL